MTSRPKPTSRPVTVKELRAAGYCVVVFSPKALGRMHPEELADSLVGYGNQLLDNVSTEEEANL